MTPWEVLGWLLVAIVGYGLIKAIAEDVSEARQQKRRTRTLADRATKNGKYNVN